MSWKIAVTTIPAPLESLPIDDAQIPFMHQCYIHTADDVTDTTMVWGSQVDMTALREWLTRTNATSDIVHGPITVLARAVALALKKHPEANRRLLGKRIYQFRECNVLLPVLSKHGPAMHLLRQVDQLSYREIAAQLRDEVVGVLAQQGERNLSARVSRRLPYALRGLGVRFLLWLANHIRMPLRPLSQHLNGAPVLINYFGFPCAPPLVAYKPSRFGSRAILLNVTLGPTTMTPVVKEDAIVVRPISGLFVRCDHRTMDARQLSNFVQAIVKTLEQPAAFDTAASPVGNSPTQVAT